MAEEETYEDILNGTGWIPGWPGTLSHGARIIRNTLTHEIVDVLPPRAVEETQAQPEEPAQEASQDAPQDAPQEPSDDNPIQVHIAVVNTSDVPPEPVQPQSDTLQDAMQRLGQ